MMTIVTNQADGYRSKYRRSSVSTSESVGQSQAGAYILPFKHFDAQLDNQCMLCHPPSICHTTCWLNIRPPPFSLSLSLTHTHTHTRLNFLSIHPPPKSSSDSCSRAWKRKVLEFLLPCMYDLADNQQQRQKTRSRSSLQGLCGQFSRHQKYSIATAAGRPAAGDYWFFE